MRRGIDPIVTAFFSAAVLVGIGVWWWLEIRER